MSVYFTLVVVRLEKSVRCVCVLYVCVRTVVSILNETTLYLDIWHYDPFWPRLGHVYGKSHKSESERKCLLSATHAVDWLKSDGKVRKNSISALQQNAALCRFHYGVAEVCRLLSVVAIAVFVELFVQKWSVRPRVRDF